jgi:hypothetical protein
MLVLMFISTNALSQSIIHGRITGNVQSGISVKLYKTSCGGDSLVDTFTSNAEGYYAFGCLDNGTYKVIPDNASYLFNPEFDSVDIPQTIIKSFDFTATINPEAIDIYVDVNFYNQQGYSVADASGLTFYIEDPRPSEEFDPTMVYIEQYWGEYPLYLPGAYAQMGVLTTYNGPTSQVNLTIVTETYTMNLDGSNGDLLNGPNSYNIVINAGELIDTEEAFRLPSQPKGLDRFIVNVYHEGTLVLTQEAIFCPPGMEAL